MSRIVVKATRPVLRRGGAINRPDLFDIIKDNTSLDFLPNYVTLKNGTQIDKAEYVDMPLGLKHTSEPTENFWLLYKD